MAFKEKSTVAQLKEIEAKQPGIQAEFVQIRDTLKASIAKITPVK